MSKISYYIFSFAFLAFYSCTPKDTGNLPTYSVVATTYENVLEIDGLVEPVDIFTYQAPPWVDGKIIYLIKDGTRVEAGETLCIIEDKGREKNYADNIAGLEMLKADLEKTKAGLAMQYALLEAQVQNNEAETKIAKLDSVSIQFLTPKQKRIRELEFERSAITKRQLADRLKSLSIINQSEIRTLELRVMQLQNRVQSSKDELDALIVKANTGGIAMRATVPFRGGKVTEGDRVWEGLPLVVIPRLEQMKVKINATEGDYKQINVNDSVEYTFDAMPGNNAKGKVLKKAPVGKALKENSKVKFFEIETSIDRMDEIPKPDISAKCKILLKQIPDTIVIPQVAVFEQDSMNVVYVQKGKYYEKRQILTGTSSSKSAIVITGLKPKEVISLSKPQGHLIRSEQLLSKKIIEKFADKE